MTYRCLQNCRTVGAATSVLISQLWAAQVEAFQVTICGRS
jgi:hypothetical protein